MQVKTLKQEGLSHEIEVTVGADEISSRVDIRLQEVGQTARIPGFRPGKVPLAIMKQKYGKAVLGEVLESAVNETSQKAMQDNEIKPALQPKIEVKSFDEGADLVYTMAVEVLPKIEVKDFKSLKVTKLVAKASDKEVDEALDRIAATRKSSQPIEGNRKTKSGDIVVIDFDGRTADDDVKQPGMAAEGHHLELGSNQFIPGFEDQLVGKNAGDEIDVKVTFPEEYQAPDLAGRDAIFEVKIHEVRETTDPVIDDEFAQSLGMDDLKALRAAVAEQTEKEYENIGRMKLKKELLDQLDDMHEFDVPQGMKDMELQSIMHQVQVENQSRGVTAEPNDEEQEELKQIADRRVRLGLVLSEIGNQNNISVADAELQKAVIAEAQKYPGQEKQVFDYFAKNREALESLRAPLYEDKVVDFMLELISVEEKEVSVEELTADDEDDSASEKAEKKPVKKKAAAKKPAAKKTTSKKKDDEEKPKAKKSAPKKKPAKKKAAE